jgi:ATP-dependent DNA ligase
MDDLARICEEIARHASRLKKLSLLAGYLRTLEANDLRLAVQFLSTGPVASGSVNHSLFAAEERSKLVIGYAVLRAAIQAVSGWDPDTLRVCHEAVGDAGETIGLLLRGFSGEHPLTLERADELYRKLFAAQTTAARRDLLIEIFRSYRPLTIKYFVRIMTRGGLRIGLTSKMVEEALALASNQAHIVHNEAPPAQPLATLHVAVTSAEQAMGGRAVYTLAVKWDGGFVNIGKADSALTDTEIRDLTRVLRRASIDRFGRVMLVKPEVVLEVAFDGIQRSPRHKSGYALCFPRIVRWRQDKNAEDCDDLARVEALYQAAAQ